MPLPLTYVGEGFYATVHCRQQEPKEPHFSRSRGEFGPKDYNTSTTVHHVRPLFYLILYPFLFGLPSHFFLYCMVIVDISCILRSDKVLFIV